mmetsp:Transcript_333/g.1229  ORF Transcript_333/g.1229 Transcript_333/m.1229 type:complete len:286 (-) Transcript_333:2007-2864(-)
MAAQDHPLRPFQVPAAPEAGAWRVPDLHQRPGLPGCQKNHRGGAWGAPGVLFFKREEATLSQRGQQEVLPLRAGDRVLLRVLPARRLLRYLQAERLCWFRADLSGENFEGSTVPVLPEAGLKPRYAQVLFLLQGAPEARYRRRVNCCFDNILVIFDPSKLIFPAQEGLWPRHRESSSSSGSFSFSMADLMTPMSALEGLRSSATQKWAMAWSILPSRLHVLPKRKKRFGSRGAMSLSVSSSRRASRRCPMEKRTTALSYLAMALFGSLETASSRSSSASSVQPIL